MGVTRKDGTPCAYEPAKPYICIYETKEGKMGYAEFSTEGALRELLEECKNQGDKILKACRIDFQTDVLECTDCGYKMKYITKEVVRELNRWLGEKRYPFIFAYKPDIYAMKMLCMDGRDTVAWFEVTLRDIVKNQINTWFQDKGLKLIWHDNGTISGVPLE